MNDGAAGALLAFACIRRCLLQRALGDADALQTDGEAGAVHHGEHRRHALVFLADQRAGRAALVAIDHGAGGRGMDAELVLDRMRARIVARAVRHEFRNQKQRNALGAGWRVGQARQHEMDDVVGQIVLAIGDEDLLAGDAVGAVGGARRPSCAARRRRSRPAAR